MIDLSRPRSLVQDLAGLRGGTLDVHRYLSVLLDRIDEVEPYIHAFVSETDRRGRLLRWAAAESTSSSGALAGIPVGVKDIISVDQMATRAGSALPSVLFDGPQAPVVDRLVAAGAVVAGKTVTAEFAVSAPGPTGNPHDVRHTPGGSSSGSAAAVAAGMVPLALGTQTIGSVIRPAAYCGVVGYRPTRGRIPTEGVIANAPSLDVVGLFTADVASAAAAAAVVCDDWQEVPEPDSPPVLGIPVGPFLERATSAAQLAFAAHVAALRAAGLDVREVRAVEDIDQLAQQLAVINRYELARVHAGWYAAHASRYRPQTAQAVTEGLAIPDAAYAVAMRRREEFSVRLVEVMVGAGLDAWVSPSATGAAPRGLGSTGDPIMSLPFSLAGLPAVSLPAQGRSGELPVGLQCVGRPGQDEQLLGWVGIAAAALDMLPR